MYLPMESEPSYPGGPHRRAPRWGKWSFIITAVAVYIGVPVAWWGFIAWVCFR